MNPPWNDRRVIVLFLLVLPFSGWGYIVVPHLYACVIEKAFSFYHPVFPHEIGYLEPVMYCSRADGRLHRVWFLIWIVFSAKTVGLLVELLYGEL